MMITTTTATRARRIVPIHTNGSHMRDNHHRNRILGSDIPRRERFSLAIALVN